MTSKVHPELAKQEDKAPWDCFKRPAKPVAEYTPAEIFEECINLAEVYLSRRGYEVLHCNWTCHSGTVDLVAKDEAGTVVLVSVTGSMALDAPLVSMPSLGAISYETDKVRPMLKECANAHKASAAQVDVIAICIRGERMAQLRHFVKTAEWEQDQQA